MKPRFDPKRRVSVDYTDEASLPCQHRGEVTDTMYVFTIRKPSVWVDRRDLPGMVKELGPDKLDGTWKRDYEEHKQKRAARKKAENEEQEQDQPPEPEADVEEVTGDDV